MDPAFRDCRSVCRRGDTPPVQTAALLLGGAVLLPLSTMPTSSPRAAFCLVVKITSDHRGPLKSSTAGAFLTVLLDGIAELIEVVAGCSIVGTTSGVWVRWGVEQWKRVGQSHG